MLCVEHSAGDGDEVPLFTVDYQEMRRQPKAESAGQPQHTHQKVRYRLIYSHPNIQHTHQKVCYLLCTATLISNTLIRKEVCSFKRPP